MKFERRKATNERIYWEPEEEVLLLRYLNEKKFDSTSLRELFPQRSLTSIRTKVRKLRIGHDLFGTSYRDTKQEFTGIITQKVKPEVVFDAYAGAGHQSFIWLNEANILFASEKLKQKVEQFEDNALEHGYRKLTSKNQWMRFKKGKKMIYLFHGDAVEAAVMVKMMKKNVDVIDLDTCGSTLPTIPIYLALLKPKHLVLTHGEFHSMRFKREDVIRRIFAHKDVKMSSMPSTVEQMSKELDDAVKLYALRSHNETPDSFWLTLQNETWLGTRVHGMLRRHYKVSRPTATADCLNELNS